MASTLITLTTDVHPDIVRADKPNRKIRRRWLPTRTRKYRNQCKRWDRANYWDRLEEDRSMQIRFGFPDELLSTRLLETALRDSEPCEQHDVCPDCLNGVCTCVADAVKDGFRAFRGPKGERGLSLTFLPERKHQQGDRMRTYRVYVLSDICR